MAKALQHDQAALIARISTACATDNEPVPDTARSGHANCNSLSTALVQKIRQVTPCRHQNGNQQTSWTSRCQSKLVITMS
jgi:hypothetical protein